MSKKGLISAWRALGSIRCGPQAARECSGGVGRRRRDDVTPDAGAAAPTGGRTAPRLSYDYDVSYLIRRE